MPITTRTTINGGDDLTTTAYVSGIGIRCLVRYPVSSIEVDDILLERPGSFVLDFSRPIAPQMHLGA